MKKSLTLIFGSLVFLANTHAFAQSTEQLPMIAVQVVDMSGKVAHALETNTLSISKKHKLCWVAFNMPLSANNNVMELFHSPDKATFSAAKGNTVSSNEQKTHLVSTVMQPNGNNTISNCWDFSKKDPLGQYRLEVRVNNIQFPARTFEVVK